MSSISFDHTNDTSLVSSSETRASIARSHSFWKAAASLLDMSSRMLIVFFEIEPGRSSSPASIFPKRARISSSLTFSTEETKLFTKPLPGSVRDVLFPSSASA